VFLMSLAAYNQHLEGAAIEDIKEELDLERRQVGLWQSVAEKHVTLCRSFTNLVNIKSEMWKNALELSQGTQPQREAAIENVRKNNALSINLARLSLAIVPFLTEHLPKMPAGVVRIAYFKRKNEHELELHSYATSDNSKPGTPVISSASETVAAFVWRRGPNEPYLIDDVQEHLKSNTDPIFRYLTNKNVRSIFCFRVEDHGTGAFLGVMCIDCNVPGFFSQKIGIEICNELATAVRSRIVYESRFSTMKQTLGNYDQGGAHNG
jgi:hypothetical protein